ncbi:MAG: hypothetical protein QF890_10675 [Myxococcota bacterium]|nr:hypothetical protein [bacterium]MDP6075515.1 hypothetical protein [Myxococcota bacterium]MDP6242822.1 hypothetical protein [Myxococcota bacterium]MDP7075963.1 hypothetical protein [Myxococcota bacterium]MDP7300175.1 hypothetical protein [Myxococcota bacterium]
MSDPPRNGPSITGSELAGWLFTALAILYAYAAHQGIGPLPLSGELAWYDPRGFLRGSAAFAWALRVPARAIVLLVLPAAALTGLVFVASRSALARTLALACLISVSLFGFYGTLGVRVWEFFFWRGSAVLVMTALIVSCALTAPLLARSWLRLGWPLRAATYLPVCFAAVALLRNATGTDERLYFSLSPWPAVTIFGLEVGGLFAMVWLAGVALGALALARRADDPRAAVIGVALGVSLPVALIAAGAGWHLLPFRPGAGTFAGLVVATALGIAGVAARDRLHTDALRERARYFSLGAALIAAPLVAGEVWARIDYHWTRDVQAEAINEAMERYYARADLYPDELTDLVAGGDMRSIPTPAIGFGFLYDGKFHYTSFGTSYLLAFTAPRWVECHYNSPFHGDLDEEELDPEDAAALESAWSCPSNPPELW